MFLFRPLKNSEFLLSKVQRTETWVVRGCSEEVKTISATDLKDRSRTISVETSIRYLKSKAFATAYGDQPVWTLYRRNFKGNIPPETRKTCIRKKRITNGSPCPICRDEYLVVDYRNTDLLKQFISEAGGELLPTKKTGVCQKQFQKLQAEIKKAYNYGTLKFSVPHRQYDYSLYCNSVENSCMKKN